MNIANIYMKRECSPPAPKSISFPEASSSDCMSSSFLPELLYCIQPIDGAECN